MVLSFEDSPFEEFTDVGFPLLVLQDSIGKVKVLRFANRASAVFNATSTCVSDVALWELILVKALR